MHVRSSSDARDREDELDMHSAAAELELELEASRPIAIVWQHVTGTCVHVQLWLATRALAA